MALNESVQVKKRMSLVEKLWQRTKADAGTTDAEKVEAKGKIEQILSLDGMKHLVFDWKKGTFVQGKQQAGTAGTAGKADSKPKQATGQTANGWTTKELSDYLSRLFGKDITAKTLRRYLRTMDKYNDHVTTHYSWSGQNDADVKLIVEFMKSKGFVINKTA